jgi:hypothetical protein
MYYYLIDYENTGENGLKGITELPEDSCVVIFYSENADKISFDMHQKFCICKTKLEFRKINTGRKNALDFQLSTYLGYLIAKNEEDQYYIVSKDNGYRSVVDFWRDKKVRQIDFIARITGKPLLITTSKEEAAQQQEEETASEEDIADVETTEDEILEAESVAETVSEDDSDAADDMTDEETEADSASEEESAEEEAAAGKSSVENSDTEKSNIEKPNIEKPIQKKVDSTKSEPKQKQESEAKTQIDQAADDFVEAEPEKPESDTLKDVLTAETDPAASQSEPEEQLQPEQKPQSEEQPKQKKPQQRKPQRKKTNQGKKPDPQQPEEFQPTEELRTSVSEVIDDDEAVEHICRFIVKYKTKQGVNNAIVKIYGTEKAGEFYKKIKPLLKDKKGK